MRGNLCPCLKYIHSTNEYCIIYFVDGFCLFFVMVMFYGALNSKKLFTIIQSLEVFGLNY